MLCGQPPFGGDNNKEIIKKIQTGKLDFSHAEFENVSANTKDLITKMLEKDPKKRVALKDALQHKVFNDESFANLKNIKVIKQDLKKTFDL